MNARQSTARTFMIGPVLDASGVAVTDSVVGDFKISVNGAAPVALNGSATLTHRHTGNYSLALTATDLATVGTAQITCDDTVNACAPLNLNVVEEAIYDALFASGATALATPTNITAGTITTVTNLTNLPAIPANWLTAAGITDGAFTAAKFAAGAFDAVWSVAARTLTSFGTLAADAATAVWAAGTRLLTAGTNIVLAKGTGITGFNDLSEAQVNAQADQAIADAGLGTVAADAAAVKAVTDKLDDMLEDDGGTPRYTVNALEQAPGGGGGALSSDQDAALTRIDRTVKGIASKRD